ncbi:MAG: TolC family protein [Pseudomonadota bacterium]
MPARKSYRTITLALLFAAHAAVLLPTAGLAEEAVPAPIVIATAAQAIRPGALDLLTCMRRADQLHPEIGPARARLEEADAYIAEAQAHMFPTLSYYAGVNYWDDDFKLEGMELAPGGKGDIVMEGQSQARAGVSVNWPVFTWNKVQNGQAAAGHELEARKLELVRVRENAIKTAICAYWTLASALEAQQYLDATINELRLFLETATEDMKKGMKNAPEKDVIQIKIDIHKMEAWRETLKRWEGTARQALSIATGLPEDQINIVDTIVSYNGVKVAFDTCLAAAYTNRTDLRALEERIKRARLEVAIQEKVNFPDLELVARGSALADDYDPSQEFHAMAGIQLRGKLDAGINKAKVEQAGARLIILEKERFALQEDIRLNVRDAYLRVQEAYNAVIQYNFARNQTMHKLDVVRSGYPMMLSDVDDVLKTQVERRMGDKDFIFSKLELIRSLALLNLVSGTSVYNFAAGEEQGGGTEPVPSATTEDGKDAKEDT